MGREKKNEDSSLDMTVYDSKGRPLFVVIRLPNGKDKWIFHRYADMLEGEKQILRKMHGFMKDSDGMATTWDDGKEVGLDESLDDFLEFREKSSDLCG